MASPRLSVLLSALVRKSQLQRQKRQLRTSWLEHLEDRRLMAVASPPTQALPVADEPIALASGLIDNDPISDAVSLSRTGQLSVALNANDGSWRSLTNVDLGLGSSFGMTGSLLNGDAYLDLVAIGSTSARVLFGDGAGSFRLGPELTAPAGGRWAPTDNDLTTATIGLLNDDLLPDIAMLDTAQNRLVIYYGSAGETFANPQTFATGGVDPTALAIGDVVGDDALDIVIGHRDGTISFLTSTLTSWSIDSAATLRTSSAIKSLATGDLDSDGDTDIAVSAGSSAYWLRQDADPLKQSPITNGNFQRGLTGWSFSSSVPTAGAAAGVINTLGGSAQLIENSSLLTSLEQTFVVPPNPQSISVNISAISLEFTAGSIPDAFELSLLSSQDASLVPTHRPGATSYFNATGNATSSPTIRLASGVRYGDNIVTLDISTLVPGTSATLVIDLVGNPPSSSSTATVSQVAIAPETIFSHTFTTTPLPGAFTRTGSIKLGDVDGDSQIDIVLADPGASRVIVFNRSVDDFLREDLNLTTLGGVPGALELAELDRQAGSDVVIAMPTQDVWLSPLRPSASTTGRTLPDIDFERDALGNNLRACSLLADEYAAWGVTVRGPAGSNVKPWILDWSRSVDRNIPAAIGKVLTLATVRHEDDHDDDDHDHDDDDDHDDDHDDRDGDRYRGDDTKWRLASGPISFDFDAPVRLDEVKLLGSRAGALLRSASSQTAEPCCRPSPSAEMSMEPSRQCCWTAAKLRSWLSS